MYMYNTLDVTREASLKVNKRHCGSILVNSRVSIADIHALTHTHKHTPFEPTLSWCSVFHSSVPPVSTADCGVSPSWTSSSTRSLLPVWLLLLVPRPLTFTAWRSAEIPKCSKIHFSVCVCAVCVNAGERAFCVTTGVHPCVVVH